jgi:hypothetical protein
VEGDNSAAGIAANRHGIPLVCIPMGVDNMHNAPMQMDPDLFVLWGNEQKDALVRYHSSFRPSLKNSKHVVSGAIPHDQLIKADRSYFDQAYPHIKPATTVVTFAAYTERGYPGQSITCELILSLFARLDIDGHLIVRMRAGLDKAVWDEFQLKYPDRVTIQDPRGALYSKWDSGRTIVRSVEEADYELFGATLKRSKLVVAASFSTVIFDAIAVGVPALASGLTKDVENRKFFRDHYRKCIGAMPAYEFLDLIIEEDRFEEQATLYLTTPTPPLDKFPNIGAYREQVEPSNGQAAKKAFDAILDLVSSESSPKG